MNEHATVIHAHVERRNFLHERRRRSTCRRDVLITVPRTGDAAVENFALAERPVLVLADVRDGRDFAVVFEDGDALSRQADDTSAVLWDVGDGASIDESVLRSSRGDEALAFGEE